MAAIFVEFPPHGKRALFSRFTRSWLMGSALYLFFKYTYALIAEKGQGLGGGLIPFMRNWKNEMMLALFNASKWRYLHWVEKFQISTKKNVRSVNRWFLSHNFAKNAGYKLPHNNTTFEATQGWKNTFLKAQTLFWLNCFSKYVFCNCFRSVLCISLTFSGRAGFSTSFRHNVEVLHSQKWWKSYNSLGDGRGSLELGATAFNRSL